MPYAISHVLFALLLVEIFRSFSKTSNFPKHYLIFALIGALLPDLDLIAYFLLNNSGFQFYEIHRTFTHSIFIPLIFLLAGILARKKKLLSNILFIITIGLFSHLMLDLIIIGKIALFYPLSNLKIGLDIINLFSENLQDFILPIIDTGFLILWVIWLDLKNNKPKLFK